MVSVTLVDVFFVSVSRRSVDTVIIVVAEGGRPSSIS